MPQYRVITADAFTTTPFLGNPCAVLPDAAGLTDEQMQKIAAEMNLAETAFVFGSSSAAFRIRFFTPRTEVPFAGHPTIATLYVLADLGRIPLSDPSTTVDIEFGIGVLPVEILSQAGRASDIVMIQPKPSFGAPGPRSSAAEGLGLDEARLVPGVEPRVAGVGVPFLMIGVCDRHALLDVRPQWEILRSLCRSAEVPAVYAFAPGDGPDTLCARFFDPFAQFEDPFTGSACGAVAALASNHGLVEGKTVTVEQGESVGRGGSAIVSLDGGDGRLSVRGQAVTVLTGTINVPDPIRA